MTSPVPKAYLTKRCKFSAAHRLHNKALTDEENKEIYQKCNHIHGHGHNYIVEVTLYGPIDDRTGMVYNLSTLKVNVQNAVLDQLDHKNLDIDVPYFSKRPSTAENIARFIYDNLKCNMDNPALLHDIKLYETDDNIVVYKGDDHCM